MKKKRILMVCEAFGGGVFTYVSQLCNDMVDDFDVYLAYSLRPQTPKNYADFLDQRVHLIEMKNVGVKGLTNLKSDIAAIKELRQIEKDVQPDVIHLHSSVAGGLGRLAYKGKNNTVIYTPHAINEGLKEYATLASTEVKKAVRKSAKTVKDQISANAPSRTGAYKGSWVATKQSETSQSLQMVVHSRNRYQLAHLLEKGHAKRGGGRVAGRPHIAPAEQAGIEQLQSLIEKALK